jgi:hypothetical protein
MEFLSHPKVMALVAIFSIPVFSTLAKLFWGERFETLGETVKYLLWPDIYSLFKGRYWDDWYASTKFNLFLFLCFSWVAAVTELLARHVLVTTKSVGRLLCSLWSAVAQPILATNLREKPRSSVAVKR